MILTEEEAKTKRCQEGFPGQPLGSGYMQATSYPQAGINAIATTPVYCLGSACMAWRSSDQSDKVKYRTGYCGKAGKP